MVGGEGPPTQAWYSQKINAGIVLIKRFGGKTHALCNCERSAMSLLQMAFPRESARFLPHYCSPRAENVTARTRWQGAATITEEAVTFHARAEQLCRGA
jgi:hypothetical protein